MPLPAEERRWVTVLYADLSGFTALAERMDHEDVKTLADRCMERLGEQVRRFGGTVIHVPGDAVVAVFGAPVAHEDDAERAVRAGLAMRDTPLTGGVAGALQIHVGINTGEAMAGLFGPQEHRDYTVVGDTVNTGQRLVSAAAPGSVLVGEETYRATRRVVRYREAPPVVARGKERPVPAWEALEVVPVPEARTLGTASLVGRDEELALLAGIWIKVVREARPHLVTVVGEPGIGKSRLAMEFERQIAGSARVIHGRCLPYGEVLSYWALAMALKEAAGVTAAEDAEIVRARLSDLVAGAIGREAEGAEVARHLALLSGLDVEADRSANGVVQRTLHGSVRRFLEALARRQPVCVMFEDIHWADDALLDLIELVASRAQEAPLLIVAQARPELLEKRPTWGRGVRAFTSLPLEPLDEPAGRQLVLALCHEHGLAEGVAEQVGRAAGGNPLFAEELVAMIAERERRQAGGGAAEGAEVGAGGIPSVIKVLIAARLDALPPEERTALQLAAVFGKLFWEGGVRALGASRDMPDHLEALEQKDLLRAQPRSQFRGDREYSFKHDLIRDVAYETLPRAERRVLHGRVADWIEHTGGERIEDYLDLLAHHTVQADQPERAMEYLIRAAERAGRAAAHRKEAALLAQSIDIAEHLGRREAVADLRARRGAALARVALWTDARADLEAALDRLPQESIEQRAQVLADLSTVCFWGLDAPGLLRYATQSQALAEQLGRDDLAAGAMSWLAETEKIDGKLRSARDLFRRAMVRGGGLRIAPLANATLTFYLLGQIDEAVEAGREALQAARGANDPLFTMYALSHLGLALAGSGRYGEAMQVFEEARRFGHEYDVGQFVSRAISMSAGLHLDVFDFLGNEALAEEVRALPRSESFPPSPVSAGIDLLLNFARRQEVGRAEKLVDEVAEEVERVAGWHGWQWKMRLALARAEIALARGDWEQALQWAHDATEQGRATGRVKYQAGGLEARAKALAALGRKHEAIASLRRAVKVARPVGDPAMFLRAATALLAIEGDDALAVEARAAAVRIAAALPDEQMRRRFEAAEPVRLLGGRTP